LLSDLDNIEWGSIQGAYGGTENVPELLKQLTSSSIEDTIQALFGLSNTVFHQFTIYPATPVVIPFLLHLLENPTIVCRARILELLGDIASVCVSITPDKIADSTHTEFYAMHQQTYEALARGQTLYTEFLSHPNPSLRMMAAYVLVQFVRLSNDKKVGRLLEDCLQRETNDVVKAGLIFAIGKVHSLYPTNIIELVEHQLAEGYQLRFASIITLIRIENRVRGVFVEELADAAHNFLSVEQAFLTPANDEDNDFHPLQQGLYEKAIQWQFNRFQDNARFPWMEYCSRKEIARCLLLVDLEFINQIKAACIYLLSIPILDIVFTVLKWLLKIEKQVKFNIASLSELQRELLEVVYHNIFLWTSLSSIAWHLQDLGLPDKRKAWQDFLEIDSSVAMSHEQIEEILYRLASRNSLKKHIRTKHDFSKVKKLSLRTIGSDSFAPLLYPFTGLTTLDISSSDFTSEGIIKLPLFPNLRDFQLPHIKLTEEAVQYLARFQNLETLNISHTSFQEAWLDYLKSLTNLKRLFISKSEISETCMKNFQEYMPNCKIWS
jgi:hypothetical protein